MASNSKIYWYRKAGQFVYIKMPSGIMRAVPRKNATGRLVTAKAVGKVLKY
jgi:hypothetical protein